MKKFENDETEKNFNTIFVYKIVNYAKHRIEYKDAKPYVELLARLGYMDEADDIEDYYFRKTVMPIQNYGTFVSELNGNLYCGRSTPQQAFGNREENVDKGFRSIIQYSKPERLMERLHQLIDGNQGATVGSILLKCKLDGYFIINPTKSQFTSEFELIGSWSAIHNYMDENNLNALDRANKIVIFD